MGEREKKKSNGAFRKDLERAEVFRSAVHTVPGSAPSKILDVDIIS